jgi:peptide/nickel transport system substrate-binding protein
VVRLLAAGAAGGVVGPGLAALAEACGSGSSSPARRSLSYALPGEPDNLNPPISSASVAGTVMSVVFAGLLRLRPDGSYEPNLAQSYQVLDGGMTYRFTLRDALAWEDGAPLTSADFAFTYQTYINPRTLAVNISGWNQIGSVDTPDARTIVVHMKQPFGSFLLHVGCALVLPKHVLSGVSDFSKAAFNRQPTGSGPFRVVRWDAASQIVLEANSRHFRGRPRLDQLVFKVIPDATTQINELRAGEVDIVQVNAVNLFLQAQSTPGISTLSYNDTKYVMVQYVEYSALKDARVRQALDYATPKQDIIKGVLKGLGAVAYGDVPPTSPYYDPHVEHHDHDLTRARALLRDAGFSPSKPLAVDVYTLPTYPSYVQVAEILKSSWQAAGVQTNVVTMDYNTLFGNAGPIWKGQDVALVYGYGQGLDPYDFVNWSSTQIPADENAPGQNLGRYINPEMDRLVVQGGLTVDINARKRVYDRIQEILAHDVPVTFLYWPRTLFAHSSWLRGQFSPTAFSGPLRGIETWE